MGIDTVGVFQPFKEGTRAKHNLPTAEAVSHEPTIFDQVDRHPCPTLLTSHTKVGFGLFRHININQSNRQSISNYEPGLLLHCASTVVF